MSSFIHLAARSSYSRCEGLVHPDELVAQAVQAKMPAIGVADRDGLAGAVRLAKACNRAGITYIPGVDLAVHDAALPGWELAQERTPKGMCAIGQPFITNGAPRITVIATTTKGLAAICRLTSAAHGLYEGIPLIPNAVNPRRLPMLTRADIQTHLGGVAGLVVLFGHQSPIIRLIRAGLRDEAQTEARRWMHWLHPRQLALGITYNGDKADHDIIRATCALGDAVGIRVTLHQAPRFLTPEDAIIADVLDAIREQVRVGATYPRRHPSAGLWDNPAAIEYTFAERPDALRYTLALGEQVDVDWRLGHNRVPHFGQWDTDTGEAGTHALTELSRIGMIERLGVNPDEHPNNPAVQRLNHELRIVTARGLASYFLAVRAIVQRIREQDRLVACRGSAASSLIAYTLRISDVNPMHYGLIMERFLHEYRKDLPDIDLDVESHHREAIQRDLITTWGANRVTGLAMVATFRARGAIREVGKALGFPEQDINLAAKAFPHTRAARIRHVAATLPEVQGLGLDAPPFQRLFAIAERLDGLPRNLALHPCGLILADSDLGNIAPLIPSGPRDNGDAIAMVPYDKDDIEDLGLVKLDLLGVRMFSAMTHAKRLAETTRGVHIDFDAIDATPDPATFAMIQRSDTIGMFQIESPGQRELIGRLTPQSSHDLVIGISLFRPGPVKGDMIEPFLRRQQGREPVNLPPLLAPILAETYGVIVYHEQVIRCISAITGCDLGQADIARRNLGNAQALPAMEDWIRSWCQRRGITQAVTDWLWHSLVQFASFGFCKAHAAAFSVPTYRSAWLKANMMPEFLAGVLTHDPGMYPARLIYAEARRHGIVPLGVSINHSQATYIVTQVVDPYPPDITFIDGDYGQAPPSDTDQRQRWAIRPALTCIRGIDMAQITSICAGQPFHSIQDVRERTQIHAPVAVDLARIGAFDEIAPTLSRGDIQLEVEERWATQPRKLAATPQLELFSAGPPVGLTELKPAHQIRAEVEVTGIDMSQHIIDWYTRRAPDATRSADLRHLPDGQRVRVMGAKVASQTPPTKSGKRIIFLTLDDGTGLADITFFPWAHRACARTVFTNWLMVVEGRIQRRGRLPTIIGERVWPLTTRTMAHQLWHASAGSSG